MAISRRLRFEILRRDGHACHYCGATAPDVALTVDHVIPVALGGGDDPANLVTACADCNSGKTSTVPDDPIVASVSDAAFDMADALRQAAAQRRAEAGAMPANIEAFETRWDAWRFPDGSTIERPANWRDSVERFLTLGLDVDDMATYIKVAMNKPKLVSSARFRYFCGCCWKEITRRQELAMELLKARQTAAPPSWIDEVEALANSLRLDD